MFEVVLNLPAALRNHVRLVPEHVGSMALVVFLGPLLGWMVVQSHWSALYASFLAGLFGLGLYVFSRSAFDKLMYLMFFTLPFQAAFVLNLGATIRPSHLFGMLALGFGIYCGRIRKVPQHPAFLFLAGFILVTIISLFMSLKAPPLSFWEVSGIRGIEIRPIIQFLQLLGMVTLMLLAIGFCSTWPRFKKAVNIIVAGALISLGYGAYGFFAPLLGVPYIDINNAMHTSYGFGYIEQGLSFEGLYIPRPRSTFQEPLNFGNFLLFAIPLAAARSPEIRSATGKIVTRAVIIFTLFLFLFSISSRGAILGAFVGGITLIAFVPRFWNFTRYLGWIIISAGLMMMVAYFLIPILIADLDLWRALEFFWYRITVATKSGGRVSEDWSLMLPLFLDHWLLGVGFGNIPFYMSRLEGVEQTGVVDAGGVYTRLLGEVGIVGTLLYLMFVGCILWNLLKVGRNTNQEQNRHIYAAAIFFSIVADAIQRVSFPGIATDVHLWVLFGLAISLSNLARKNTLNSVTEFSSNRASNR